MSQTNLFYEATSELKHEHGESAVKITSGSAVRPSGSVDRRIAVFL